MDTYIIVVSLCLILSLVMLFTKVRFQINYLGIVFKLLILIGIVKYISLLVFYSADSPKYIYYMRFMPILSLVSVFILGYIMIYYSLGKNLKLKEWSIVIIILILGTCIIFNLPFGIKNSEVGYALIKNKNWVYGEYIFIIFTSLSLIAISLKSAFKFKKVPVKIKSFLVSLAFLVVALEAGMAAMNKEVFHFNVIGDLAVLITLIIILISSRNNKKQT